MFLILSTNFEHYKLMYWSTWERAAIRQVTQLQLGSLRLRLNSCCGLSCFRCLCPLSAAVNYIHINEDGLLFLLTGQCPNRYCFLHSYKREYLLYCAYSNPRALFHKTLKTSLPLLEGLCKDVFMFYETEPRWSDYRTSLLVNSLNSLCIFFVIILA